MEFVTHALKASSLCSVGDVRQFSGRGDLAKGTNVFLLPEVLVGGGGPIPLQFHELEEKLNKAKG